MLAHSVVATAMLAMGPATSTLPAVPAGSLASRGDVPTSITPIFAARPSQADSAAAGCTAGPTAMPMARTLAGEAGTGGEATGAIAATGAPSTAGAGRIEANGTTLPGAGDPAPSDLFEEAAVSAITGDGEITVLILLEAAAAGGNIGAAEAGAVAVAAG